MITKAQYSTPNGYGNSSSSDDSTRTRNRSTKQTTYHRFMFEGGVQLYFINDLLAYSNGANLGAQMMLEHFNDHATLTLGAFPSGTFAYIASTYGSRSIFSFCLPVFADLNLGAGASSETTFPIGCFLGAGFTFFNYNNYVLYGPAASLGIRGHFNERTYTLRLFLSANVEATSVIRELAGISLNTRF
jgi:hypothetical protein